MKPGRLSLLMTACICSQTPILFRGIGLSVPPESRLVSPSTAKMFIGWRGVQ